MSICPHCKKASLPPFKAFFSYADQPVQCRDCSGLSYVPGSATLFLNFLLFPGVLVPLVAAANMQSVWPIALFASVCTLEFVRILLTVKPVAIAAAEVRVRRRHGNIFLFALGLSAIGYIVIVQWLG